MMRTISESFNLIINKQKLLGYPYQRVLRGPVDCDLFEVIKNEIGIEFNDELKELYFFADGIEIDYQLPVGLQSLIPIHIFMSIKDALVYYKNHIEFEESFFNWNTNYKPGKKIFPFLEDGSGNCYWVDLNKDTNNYGEIYWTNTFNEPPDYLYASLRNMFQVISECYDENLIFTDEYGLLDMDFSAFDNKSRVYNNNLSYWKV